ncbi:MAG: protein-L-isoaspartate(D-aspartate) O-methyltransferase [Deferribacteres bacterium]|nr:protein-L-isoaspartate(D-aspartate) O-methyltransferase [candidate division KSB1 bacterium]MCB9502402.1 protein-L-isoaspartate(D-aspartate) O-methyltransferase [Deferribacteres bacterium]
MNTSGQSDDDLLRLRLRMVEKQIVNRGIKSNQVLKALKLVPRHFFVPPKLRYESYDDNPLPIGYQQTISQPYIVALMTETLDLEKQHLVLEIGTGSGYQTAILALLSQAVVTVEIIPQLHRRACETLTHLKFENITAYYGDACAVLPKEQHFDRIMVTAAAERIPRHLVNRLNPGGKMIIPIGHKDQQLKMVIHHGKNIDVYNGPSVRFVPITGRNFSEQGLDD